MRIFINDLEYPCVENAAAFFVSASVPANSVQVRVVCEKEPREVTVRPLIKNIRAVINKNEAAFTAGAGDKLSVEFNGNTEKPLFLFLYEKETVDPSKFDYYFDKGIHEIDEIKLKSGQSLYVAEGAFLRAHIKAEDAENIFIGGRGVIDITGISAKWRCFMQFMRCKNITVRDITLMGSIWWDVVPVHCEDVNIENINIMSWEVNGDGIDVCGCKNVNITGCFIYSADDCIAVKACSYYGGSGCNNSENINVRRCVFWNTVPGNAMEIGFETVCDEIKNVTFEDIDVLHCFYEGMMSGGVFTIHNGDRAHIRDITYRNIRVEDASQKLFDFKVVDACYSQDKERGFISNITAEDIHVIADKLPPSVIRGFAVFNDRIGSIKFRNLNHKGERLLNFMDARFIIELCRDVTFE